MPIIDDLNLPPKTRVVIWEINESLQNLESKIVLSENSLKLLNQKKSEIQKKTISSNPKYIQDTFNQRQ